MNEQGDDDLLVRIPLEVRTGELTRSLRRLLQQHKERSRLARRKAGRDILSVHLYHFIHLEKH